MVGETNTGTDFSPMHCERMLALGPQVNSGLYLTSLYYSAKKNAQKH